MLTSCHQPESFQFLARRRPSLVIFFFCRPVTKQIFILTNALNKTLFCKKKTVIVANERYIRSLRLVSVEIEWCQVPFTGHVAYTHCKSGCGCWHTLQTVETSMESFGRELNERKHVRHSIHQTSFTCHMSFVTKNSHSTTQGVTHSRRFTRRMRMSNGDERRTRSKMHLTFTETTSHARICRNVRVCAPRARRYTIANARRFTP